MYVDDDVKHVSEAYVAFCREHGGQLGCAKHLYDDNAVSVEPFELENLPEGVSCEAFGLDEICKKHDWFFSQFDVLSYTVEGPYYHGEDQFGVQFTYDIRHKESGETFPSKELGIYTVKDKKITREAFFQQP